MEGTEMEVDEQSRSQSSASSKRYALNNVIQTNFGDDYVFQISPKEDWSAMAVSLSSNLVKLYSPATGQFLGECTSHDATINNIAFSAPHLLHSCSSDGTLRAWDTRTFQQAWMVNAGPGQEIFSFSFESEGNLFAGGCKSLVLLWDLRNRKQVACLEESHVDDVTQVHFIPGTCNKLLSASVDGLMCTFDTAGDVNDDDHLESVMNVGTSIGRVGFYGDRNQKTWCLSHIESLSVWDWKEAKAEVDILEARSLASDSWNRDDVDYFVDCYSGDDERLWLIGGTNGGTLGYFPVGYTNGRGIIGSPEAILEGGHTGVVRTVLPMSRRANHPHVRQSVFGWTGGEDGKLCCWLSDQTSDLVNRAWISTDLVIKNRRKTRHHCPY